MMFNDFIKLFIPPIVLAAKHKLHNICKTIQKSPLPKIERHSDKMIVIGNGPSLNESIEKYIDDILLYDKTVVNFFASTELYELLKPNVYVFADPAFFDLPERLKDSILLLFDNIVKKTTWRMYVIIPSSVANAKSIDILRQNKNLKICCYFNGYQDIGKRTKFEAWDENLIAPPAQTVLNTCVYLSLFWNYEETYLIGADTSFLEDVRIDQKTNELFVIDSHFYKQEKVYTMNHITKGKGAKMDGWTLHDLVFAYGNMFKLYSDLKDYADYKGLKVYNASEYSWINVFERKKLR